jgi:hypothetical protein
MLKINRLLLLGLLTAGVVGCSNTPNGQQWDFDHEVQFTQTELSPHHYELTVMQSNKVPFAKLATFLLRRSLILCGEYGYKLEVIKGVEGFDDKFSSPNFIRSNLSANLECPSHK